MSNTNTQTTQVNAVLAQIERFGFKFFGHGENNELLVIAPNGQIIPLKVAYEFVQQQIVKANSQSSGNIESIPSIPAVPDSGTIEVSLEKSTEKEGAIDKAQESQVSTQPVSAVSTPQPSDDKPLNVNMEMPIGEGFKITKFDPTDIKQAADYVRQNKGSSSESTKKWLAVLFDKFIKEYEVRD